MADRRATPAPAPAPPLLRAEPVTGFVSGVRRGETVTATVATSTVLVAATDHGFLYVHDAVSVRRRGLLTTSVDLAADPPG